MLTRVLEPEVMDSHEEARDYDAMDHALVNRAFVADFLAFFDPRGQVLDVGTGTALIPIEFCRQSSAAKVVALDAAHHMLQLAQTNVEGAGFSKRIHLQHGDAKQLPFADGSFGAVMSNSIVHHIPHPHQTMQEMVRVTAPGGCLFVRDLLRPNDNATIMHLVATYAANATARQRKLFEDSLRAALELGEVRDIVKSLGCDPGCVHQTSDRHWTWAATK